jgi:nucleoside transporter
MTDTQISEAPVLSSAPSADPGLRFKLSGMMFLQYAIWGIWAPILGRHLATLTSFQGEGGAPDQMKIGLIYMTMPIASIVGPFIGGQIADRYFAAQRFLALSQFLGGIVLLVVARLTGFTEVFVGMLVYNLLYAPTIALTNSISFQHWPNDQFSKIRVWGSVGWIVIGWVFGVAWMKFVGPRIHETAMVDCLYFAGALSLVYGVFALVLPHTPPAKQAGNPLAFLDAVGMLRNPAFAVMALISFFVAIDMQLYFVWTQSFLGDGLKIPDNWIGPILTAGQICEMVMMVLLPFALARFGFKYTMVLGIAAWGLRDLVFAVGQPTPLVVGSISLHGVGFAFFFTTIFMFTDAVAPKDIKSSAQSFLASVTIGCGMLVGSLLAGPVSKACGGNWHQIYVVPALLCAVCCVLFLVGFRPQEPRNK